MKPLRLLLIGTGVLAILGVSAVVLAFSSGFQTWAARRALAGMPGLGGTVGRVDAGLGRVRVENLRLAPAGGPVVTVPALEVELPLLAAVRSRIEIERIVARGWTVDLTSPGTPGSQSGNGAQAAAAGAGILKGLLLPFDLSVATVDIQGEAILPGARGAAPVRSRIAISGGGLGAGREASFNISATASLAPGGPVSSLEARGMLAVSMSTPRSFASIRSSMELDARGGSLPQGARLSIDAGASQANSGEAYTLVLKSGERDLMSVSATQAASPAGTRPRIAGNWLLDMRDSDVAPFALGRSLPGFSARGNGRFETDTAFRALHAAGHVEAGVERLGVLSAELRDVGALGIVTDFDVAREGSTWRVSSLALDVTGPVLNVRTTQPFEFNPATRELKVADPARDLLVVELRGVPLQWGRGFHPGIGIEGGPVRGNFAVGALDRGFSIRSTSPLAVEGLSLAVDSQPMLQAVDASLRMTATYSPQGWQAEAESITLRRGATELLSAQAKAGRLAGAAQALKAQAGWTVNLAALSGQPAAARLARLRSGNFTGSVVATLGTGMEFEAGLALGQLALESGTEVLPALSTTARVSVGADGRYAVSIPLLLESRGRRSDIAFTGTAARMPGRWSIEGRSESQFLAIDDAKLLAGTIPPAPPNGAGPSRAATPAANDARPGAPSGPAWPETSRSPQSVC